MKKVSAPDWASTVVSVRRNLGLTQDEFAVKVGVAKSTLSYWESGKIIPHLRTQKRIMWAAGTAQAQADSAVLEQARQQARSSGRYSAETVAQLHQALDIIIDRAPSEGVKKVTEVLEAWAGKWGDHPRRASKAGEPHIVSSELDTELNRIANEQGLDTSHILHDALSLGLAALARDLTAKRQLRSNKEAKRAHSRS